MIKLRLIFIPLILVVAIMIAGCGGGGARSSATASSSAILSTKMVEANLNTLSIGTGVLIPTAASSANRIGAQCTVIPPDYQEFLRGLQWLADGEGGYQAEGDFGQDHYLFYLRYDLTTVRLEVIASQGVAEIYHTVIEGTKNEAGLWNGDGWVEGLSFAGEARVNMTFTNLDAQTGAGNYTFSIGETTCATFQVIYAPETNPDTPIHIIGEYDLGQGSVLVNAWYVQFFNAV